VSDKRRAFILPGIASVVIGRYSYIDSKSRWMLHYSLLNRDPPAGELTCHGSVKGISIRQVIGRFRLLLAMEKNPDLEAAHNRIAPKKLRRRNTINTVNVDGTINEWEVESGKPA
jgi:hypothetical protein